MNHFHVGVQQPHHLCHQWEIRDIRGIRSNWKVWTQAQPNHKGSNQFSGNNNWRNQWHYWATQLLCLINKKLLFSQAVAAWSSPLAFYPFHSHWLCTYFSVSYRPIDNLGLERALFPHWRGWLYVPIGSGQLQFKSAVLVSICTPLDSQNSGRLQCVMEPLRELSSQEALGKQLMDINQQTWQETWGCLILTCKYNLRE